MTYYFGVSKDFFHRFIFALNSFLVFWYLSNSLIGNRSPATSLLLLLSILTVVPVVKNISACWKSQKWWILGLVTFGLFNILSLLHEGVEISDAYDKPAKALVAALVFLYLLHYGFNHRVVGVAIVIATLMGGGYAIYEKFVLGLDRAGMMTNPIRYGYMVAALALLCFFCARYSQQRWQQLSLAAAGCIGLAGAYSTGTRGVVVILLSVVAFLMFSLLRKKRISWPAAVALGGIFITVIAFSSVKTGVFKSYIDNTHREYEQIKRGNLNTSIGLRFQMWHLALYLGLKEPLSGAGHDYDKLREKSKGFIEEKGYNPIILTYYGHFHNQFLDCFAKQGVPGVVVWMLFLAGALLGMKTRYKYAVFLIVATLAVGGLTEAVLRSSRLFYLAILGISIFRCLDYFEFRQRMEQKSRPKPEGLG